VVKVRERLATGDRAHLFVDAARRQTTRANHSAAHLVHAALRHVLGPHVAQKGQLVDGERMRFDFSHSGPLTPQEIDRIETEVNAVIRQNVPAETKTMAPQEAIEAGAVALFGEKYGDSVRVLTLGKSLLGDGSPYSVELCGGTHVARTGDIALFKIVSEQGIAAGGSAVEEIGGVKFDGRVVDGVSPKDMRPLVDEARKRLGDNGVVAYAAVNEGKAAIAVALTPDLVGRFNAADLARAAVQAMGGQGAGGKPDFAQGGAPDGSKAAEGVAAVKAALA